MAAIASSLLSFFLFAMSTLSVKVQLCRMVQRLECFMHVCLGTFLSPTVFMGVVSETDRLIVMFHVMFLSRSLSERVRRSVFFLDPILVSDSESWERAEVPLVLLLREERELGASPPPEELPS